MLWCSRRGRKWLRVMVSQRIWTSARAGFAVVGYGKLGGWELGYSSDLDLIFLHDCPMDVMTNGEREIDGRQFYLRPAQRIMHLFSTRTSSGILYEVDARLRPLARRECW